MSGEIIPFPKDADFDEARIEDLLGEHDGDIRKVAKRLGVSSARLRKFVAMSPLLKDACEEVFEGAVDEAVAILFEGLRDVNSFQNRFYAAKEFLRTNAARRRGFGHDASATALLELKDKGGHKTITLRWLDVFAGGGADVRRDKNRPWTDITDSGELWMSQQAISVWLGRMLRDAFAAGLDDASVSEAVVGSLASILADRRKKREREFWLQNLDEAPNLPPERPLAERPSP